MPFRIRHGVSSVIALVLISVTATRAICAPPHFPVRQRLPVATNTAVQSLLDWQRDLFDLPESSVLERFGEPDERRALPPAPTSHQLIYHLTRRSNLEITITQGDVSSAAMILMPSLDESGPLDDWSTH